MVARGHQVAIAGRRGPAHDIFQQAPWPWIDLPLDGGPLALWNSVRRLRRYLADHPVDLLHAHYRKAVHVGRWIQHTIPVPLLFTLHLSHLQNRAPWRRWFSDFGDHTHVASQQARQWLLRDARLPPEKISVIPHGIDPLRFPRADAHDRQKARQFLRIADNQCVAIYVGRLDYPKNVMWMLDLAAQRKLLPNLQILLVGDGPEEARLRSRITADGLADRVRLLGHLDDPLPAYQAADALLLPSLREGFSLVTAEAMSVGIPVLRTRTSGTEELIREGQTGISVPIDHDAFIAGCVEFLADRAHLAALGRHAADHVRSHFTFDRQLQQTLDLYRRLIAPSRKTP